MLACPCFSVVIGGQDMLSACMRATFKDVSTLGIVMGDTNIGCGEVAKVLERNIGAIQDCDYHPKTPNFNDRLDLVTGDYVFAGEATTTNIPCDKLVGLDGDHVAILARVTFRGPRCVELADDASTLAPAVTGNPDTQPQDVARAEALLGRLHGQAVPHEQEPSDSAMAAPSVEHQHEIMLLGRMHRQDLQEGETKLRTPRKCADSGSSTMAPPCATPRTCPAASTSGRRRRWRC